MKSLTRKFTVALIFVLLLVVLLFVPAMAMSPRVALPALAASPGTVAISAPLQQADLPFTDLTSFLLWVLTGPGLVFLSGAFVSYVLAKLTFWNALNGDIKSVVTFLLPGVFLIPTVLLALHFGVIVPEEIPNRVLTALVFYFATQFTFVKLRESGQIRYPAKK